MEFKKEYLEKFNEKSRLESIIKAYNEKPHSANIRQAISFELFNEPGALTGVTGDVVDNYVNLDVGNKFKNSLNEVYSLTDLNLDRILNDLIPECTSIKEHNCFMDVYNLIMPLPPHKVDGGRYDGLSDAHIKAQEAEKIYKEKNVESVLKTFIEDYNISQESLEYHAKADAEGLIKIYGGTVFKSRMDKLGDKLSDEKGNLDKTKTVNFSKYLVSKAEGESKSVALDSISRNAFEMYRPKGEKE